MAEKTNFSERSKRPTDPHRWEESKAELIYNGRLLDTLPIYVCSCEMWSLLEPKFIRSDDLGVCEPKPTKDADQGTTGGIGSLMTRAFRIEMKDRYIQVHKECTDGDGGTTEVVYDRVLGKFYWANVDVDGPTDINGCPLCGERLVPPIETTS